MTPLDRAALESAAHAALHAPSIFNTQPWAWRVTGDALELHADPARRLDSTDRDGRLLLVSCGAALHHARTALTAAGRTATVERLPDDSRADLLARIRVDGSVAPDPQARRLAAAIPRRRTDRRAFGSGTVSEAELTKLRRAVADENGRMHLVRPDQIAMLAISAALAGTAQLGDPAYRAELHHWTTRPRHTGDGVPPATAIQRILRRVPLRDFTPDTNTGPATQTAYDPGAAYVVLVGDDDQPAGLLRGGEALSALLLAATADGLATAPMSDILEVPWPRRLVRDLLAGPGEPFLVVRLGYVTSREPLAPAPRREPTDVITIRR